MLSAILNLKHRIPFELRSQAVQGEVIFDNIRINQFKCFLSQFFRQVFLQHIILFKFNISSIWDY
ncbi:hypothetical protein pb186bvf_005208 [Paramecium bursaria]